MNSRERVLTALDHREPDRIPVDFWASAGFKERIHSELGLAFKEFLDRHDVDLRYIEGPLYTGPPLTSGSPGVSIDIWGVPRKEVALQVGNATEYYEEVTASPLSEAEDTDAVEAYPRWPSPDWFDYSGVRAQCEAVHAEGRAVVFMGDRLNRIAQLKPAMYLCGVDTVMLNMAMRPAMVKAVFDRISTFYLEYTERILAAADGEIDIVCTGDDFGSQNGLLMSPAMWDDFLRTGFAAFNDLIHAHGARSMHHTCGAVAELIPRLMDSGLDILQSIQPEAAGMDHAAMKSEYGDRLSFQGGISIQKTMPFGTRENIRTEAAALAADLGSGGGFIFGTAHNIQADTPVASAGILLEAYREFGKY